MKRGQRAFDGGKSGFGSALGGGGSSAFGGASGGALSYLAEPPDFAAVSDPNVVVSLKNILKKDSTTKTKGLEDLVQYVQAHPFDQDGGVEEGILDIWTQLYARISIDNSRRVRELSHTLQFELLKSARKRMERRVPKVVGSWLAGLYDRDRVVSRAAGDGLSSFLTTPEKLSAFWVKCQGQILDFAVEAIRETQDTLSDERSTKAEDAEAKYFRVVTASLSLVLALLQRADDAEMQKSTAKYDEFFAEETVWKSITFADSAVRKTVCQLLFACLHRKLPYGETQKARQAFVTGGLKTNQAGSALEYVRALTKLTQHDASIWTSPATEKKSALTRLQSFISKGSQGSPPKFWEALDQFLALIPLDTLGLEAASKLLSSVKAGIVSREEPRTNTSYSWKCFIDVAKRSLKKLPDESKLAFAQEHLFPMFEQFIFSSPESKTAIPMGPNAMSVFVEAHLAMIGLTPDLAQASEQDWDRLGGMLCSNISGSLPEVSKEYKASQNNIGEQGRRWFGLVGQINNKLSEANAELPDQTTLPSDKIISQCTSILASRNMKPFGAAQILEYALSTAPHLFKGQAGQRLATFFQVAVEEGLDTFVASASLRYLISCIEIFGTDLSHHVEYKSIWMSWTEATLGLSNLQQRNATLALLVSQSDASALARDHDRLQDAFFSQASAAIEGEAGAWQLLEAAIVNQAMNETVSRKLAAELVGKLKEQPQDSSPVLRLLEVLAKSKPALFAEEPVHTELVTQLLSLAELEDGSVSSRVAAIRSLLDSHTAGSLPVVDIIQSNLERAGPQSLSIDTLVSQAKSAMTSENASWEQVFPSTNVWMGCIGSLLDERIDPSLSITANIAGAVVLPSVAHSAGKLASLLRDRNGRCVPARMAIYTNELLKGGLGDLGVPKRFLVELLFLQCLAVQLATDQITTMSRNKLWLDLALNESGSEAEEFISESRMLLNGYIAKASDWQISTGDELTPSSVVRGIIDFAMKESRELSTRASYSARVLGEILQGLTEAHGIPNGAEETFLKLDHLRTKPDTALLAAGLVSGFGDAGQSSKSLSNFCNRLVSDAAAVTPDGERTHTTLALLTNTAQIYEKGELPVANNRIVFAVRQLTSWLDGANELSPSLCAEIFRALNVLLPCMTDVYGSYWESSLQFCTTMWRRAGEFTLDDALPFIHASLKLVKILEGISEPNDDLEEALRDFNSTKAEGLIDLLRLDRQIHSQPLEIVDAMLCREVGKIPAKQIPATEELFGLVSSDSRDIQTAAFNLLHKKIPDEQEQKSVDILLDKSDARLPDELLSLFLDPPTLEKFSDEALSNFPTSIRCYLLSWKLVFDAYASSSFKIRNDFTEQLKSEGSVGPLLDFMFDVLGHSAAHPLNLDKENIGPQQICDYNIDLAEAESQEKSLHWLLVHLYYLTLKYTSGPFRSWYIDCRSKQTRIAVEAWTTKYFSPVIIAETLDGVQAWADQQEPPAGDEQELLVKVSKPAREVTAGYEVDESQAAIVIKVPPSFPIDTVSVSGLTRVAVTEKKWQSWIMTTQGVITFSNGSIIDGLQVFKRNIIGALKGQSECAICYSVISTDKRMPDKKCTTCKNLFHRTCLYKWFQTSNQNTCPLCRNPIDYLGADTQKRRQG